MVASAPLIITPEVRADLAALRAKAAASPVDARAVLALTKTPHGMERHMDRMMALTITIPGPFDFRVSFSIETGQAAGVCRHLSMSVDREGRAPTSAALWMVAEELGFEGGLDSCVTWSETVGRGRTAINLVQPIAARSAPSCA